MRAQPLSTDSLAQPYDGVMDALYSEQQQRGTVRQHTFATQIQNNARSADRLRLLCQKVHCEQPLICPPRDVGCGSACPGRKCPPRPHALRQTQEPGHLVPSSQSAVELPQGRLEAHVLACLWQCAASRLLPLQYLSHHSWKHLERA